MTCLGHVPEGSKPPFCLMSLLGLDPNRVKYDLFGTCPRGSILRETLNKRGGLGPCLGVVWSNPGSEGVRSKVPSATLAWIPSLGPEVTKSGQKGGYSGRGPNMTQNDLFCLMSLLGLSIGRGPKSTYFGSYLTLFWVILGPFV